MPFHKQLMWAVLLMAVTSSCGPQVSIMVNESYRKQAPITGKTLAIYPTIQGLNIDNASSLNDDLGGGVPEEVFVKFARKELRAAMLEGSHFREIVLPDSVAALAMKRRDLEVTEKLTVVIDLPLDGQRVQFDDRQVDFVLFLNRVESKEEFTNIFNAATNSEDSERHLVIYFQFLIWDNQQGQIVSYGGGQARDQVFIKMNENTWRNAIRNMAQDILKESPFDRKITR